MKLYILIQEQYQEGNFGDLEDAPSLIHGIFRNIDKAKDIAKTINIVNFKAQFGSAEETLYLLPIKSDIKLEELDYTKNLLEDKLCQK